MDHDMAQQKQKLEPLTEKQQSHKPRSWVPWAVAFVVLGAILVFAITVLFIVKSQGINQGTVTLLTVLSIIVGTVVALLGLLFTFLQWFHSRPSHSSGSLPLSTIPYHEEVTDTVSLRKPIPVDMHQEDWGEAPHIEQFYGREHEQAELKQWIVDDHCRMVAVLGIGGIGKTSLTAVVAEQMKDEFDSVFWRSLQNAPPLESMLQSCIQFLSHEQQVDLPDDVESQITLLIQYLREHRCLLVFDNFETVLQAGDHVGHYREGYEEYSRLIQRVGEARHQSCLVLTSREKPKEVAFIEGDFSLVRSHKLEGLKSIDGQEILKDKGLRGEEKSWEALVLRYEGNPLALKIVAQFIREVFAGDIASFLETGEAMFSTIRHVLEQQFSRLTALEREIMYWLAIEREGVSLDELDNDLVRSVTRRALLEAIESLRRRSMIEISGMAHFTQQPVIMEYVIDELAGQVYKEIDTGPIELFASHALIKARAKDYIRDSQVHLILTPIAERLLTAFGKEGSEQKLKNILYLLRETSPPTSGYAAGNALNLLIHLQCDLRGYDFSHLTVWQAYLQSVALLDVNFAYANFAKSVFTETFGSIFSVAFSPSGDLLAAGTGNGEIRLWHIPSSTPYLTFTGHTDWVRSVAFSPDGQTLASASADLTIRLWEVRTGQCLKILYGHTDWVRSVAFSPDGQTLASASDDHTIRSWDISTGHNLNILKGHTARVRSVAFSPDGQTLASASADLTIRLWEVRTGQCLQILQEHTSRVYTIAFSPEGRIIASGSDDQTVRLWEFSTGRCLRTLLGHTDRVYSINFSPDGMIVASGSYDKTVRLWEISTGRCLNILGGHSSWIKTVSFSPDGRILASGSEDQTIRLWEISTSQYLRTLQGHANSIQSVAFSPNGRILASGNEDRTIQIWEVSTGRCLGTWQGHTSLIWAVAFNPDGRILASGSEDHTIRLWNVDTGRCINTLHGHSNRVRSVAFSPDGRILASSSEDQTVRLWNVSTGHCFNSLHGHKYRVWSVVFSPDGSTLASGGEDHSVRLWEVGSGRCLISWQGHTSRVYSTVFSPDGTILASSSEDQTIRLWGVHTGHCLKILQGHPCRIWAVAFSPDGNILASGNDDQTIQLWEVQSGQCHRELRGHTDRIGSVVFSLDGRLLASSSYDGTIKLWDAQIGECLQTFRSDKPYEHMNITGIKGLTEAQKATLKALGAVEDTMGALS
jgi:WD40 repeat protein